MTDEDLTSLLDRALNALREAKEHPYDWLVDDHVRRAYELIEDASIRIDSKERRERMNVGRSRQVMDALRGVGEPLTIPQIIDRMIPIEGDTTPINRELVNSTLYNLKRKGKVANGPERFCKGSKWLSTWRLLE